MMKIKTVIIILLLFTTFLMHIINENSVVGQTYSISTNFEIDASMLVYKVVDGDTVDGFPLGRIRLADINTPERGEPGYNEAKQTLMELVLNKKVYLDVDDVAVIDQYNRIVAIVYVRHNSTHLLNINKWLLQNGYAEI